MSSNLKSIIYNGIHTDISCDLLNRLIDSCGSLNHLVSIVSYQDGLKKVNFKNIKHFEVDYRNAMDGIYPFESVQPLDQTTLDQLNPYWFVAFKMLDRHAPEMIYSYHSRVKLLLNHIRYWDTILTKYNVECFISNNYPHEVYDYVLYALCKAKGIKTLFFDHVQIEGHVQLLDSIEDNTPELQRGELEKIALSPIFEAHWQKKTNAEPPFWVGLNEQAVAKESSLSYRFKKIFAKLRAAIIRLVNKRPPSLQTIVKILYFKTLFGSVAEKNLRKEYDSLSSIPDYSEKFIYIPLHFQPECTTSPQGGYYVFQELMIEMLSHYLPDGIKLYVKEHPFQKIHGRTPGFYQHIANIKNVILIDRSIPSSKLIKHCFSVATVTGTAGWEALFQNKKVMLFGPVFFQHAPGVYRIRTKEDCEMAMKEVLATNGNCPSEALRLFMKTLEGYLVRGWIDPPHEKLANIDYQQNLNNLINALMKRLSSS